MKNLNKVYFLDMTFNLRNGTFKSHRKPNDKSLSKHTTFSHPASIIQRIQVLINRRLSVNPSNDAIFNVDMNVHKTARKYSGFWATISYIPDSTKKANRKSNIILSKPQYSKNVKTNVEKIFIQLKQKHFPA